MRNPDQADDHDREPEAVPERSRQILVGADLVETRDDRLKDDQRNGEGRDAAQRTTRPRKQAKTVIRRYAPPRSTTPRWRTKRVLRE